MIRLAVVILFLGAVPALADPAAIAGQEGKALIIELVWSEPVDLDLFVTDPAGETVYFANREARSGLRMGAETGCRNIAKSKAPYKETAVIRSAKTGRYRVSVDFIKDCGTNVLEAEFTARLLDGNKELGQGGSMVKYRVLEPVGWEFEIR